MTGTAQISLILSKAESIVLFEWLARLDSASPSPGQTSKPALFEDEAEKLVLWRLEAQLEKALTEPFLANCQTILAEARNIVRSESSG